MIQIEIYWTLLIFLYCKYIIMNSRDILQTIAEHISDRQTFYLFAICSKKTGKICKPMKYKKRKEFEIVHCNILRDEDDGAIYCDWNGKYTRGNLTTHDDPSCWKTVWFKNTGAHCAIRQYLIGLPSIDDNTKDPSYMTGIRIGDTKLQRLIDELESKYNKPFLCNYTNWTDPLIEIYCNQYGHDSAELPTNCELLISCYDDKSEENTNVVETKNKTNNSYFVHTLIGDDSDSDFEINDPDVSNSAIYGIWVVNNKRGIISELKDVLYRIKEFESYYFTDEESFEH